jgi:hypothetical protein
MPYINPKDIAQAKEMDLLTYLQNYEPQELVHVSGTPIAPVSMTASKSAMANGTGFRMESAARLRWIISSRSGSTASYRRWKPYSDGRLQGARLS